MNFSWYTLIAIVLARNDEEWFSLRKTAQKALLRQKSINKYLPTMSAIADEFVEKFQGEDRINDVLRHLMEFSTEGKRILLTFT
jgi:cytochrome P450